MCLICLKSKLHGDDILGCVCFVLKTNTPIKILIQLGIGAKNPYVNWPVLKTGV